MGAQVIEHQDGITIRKDRLRKAEIETYNDHRITMSFAISGLKTGKLTIKNPQNVIKSFPSFFEIIQKLQNRK